MWPLPHWSVQAPWLFLIFILFCILNEQCPDEQVSSWFRKDSEHYVSLNSITDLISSSLIIQCENDEAKRRLVRAVSLNSCRCQTWPLSSWHQMVFSRFSIRLVTWVFAYFPKDGICQGQGLGFGIWRLFWPTSHHPTLRHSHIYTHGDFVMLLWHEPKAEPLVPSKWAGEVWWRLRAWLDPSGPTENSVLLCSQVALECAPQNTSHLCTSNTSEDFHLSLSAHSVVCAF